ncbi:MAG TPA: hypothetical protein VL133_13480, partial [Devosia sp.]|nr:hypothetical protein [Devosia sp.]
MTEVAGSSYRSLILPDGSYDLGYFSNDVKHVATVRVGEIDNPPTVFSIMTALVPTPLLPMGGFEFMFAVIEFDV